MQIKEDLKQLSDEELEQEWKTAKEQFFLLDNERYARRDKKILKSRGVQADFVRQARQQILALANEGQ